MAGADLTARGAQADIQGLVRTGYGNLVEAEFLLLNIADPAAARAWLANAPVTPAAERAELHALQVALSAEGMRALGLADPVLNQFSPEFLAGMAGDEARSRRLGDIGASAPEYWRWGKAAVPHMLLLLYARSDIAAWRASAAGDALFARGFALIDTLRPSNMGNREPFGFVDGISQPQLDWNGQRRVPGPFDSGYGDTLTFGNRMAAGEFLLGYPNEYGLFTERPLLTAAEAGGHDLPPAAGNPAMRDLGRNGSYLVLRELHQDVRGFWQFFAREAGTAGAIALAEKMVGRHIDGEPLIPAQTGRIDGIDDPRNRFSYDVDPAGLVCPVGAHVRRGNPRTGDMPPPRPGALRWLIRTLGLDRPGVREDLIASSRFHRVLRRGREFGAYIEPQQAMAPDTPDPHSGLYFICLNANIQRQFEFVQNAWLSSARFGGLSGENDPLTGPREVDGWGAPPDRFTLPQPNGAARCIQGLPAFVEVRGGGYFFLPGIRALRYIAAADSAR